MIKATALKPVTDITVCAVTNFRHNAIQTLKEINNTALCLFRKAAQAEMEVFLFCYIEPSQVIEKTSDFYLQHDKMSLSFCDSPLKNTKLCTLRPTVLLKLFLTRHNWFPCDNLSL